jgi:hypothetical protein
VTGNNAQAIASLSAFSTNLRRLPTVVAQMVAAEAAPVLTALVAETFAASETAYGIPWTPGADGERVTLKKSGGLANGLQYVAIGTKLRLRLAVSYAKYQVGKRPVAPSQGGALPPAYSEALARAAVAVCKRELGR